MRRWRLAGAGAFIIFAVAAAWLAATDDVRVWPLRNTVQYRAFHWWWAHAGAPQAGAPGTLRGAVRDTRGQPIAGARVLVAGWDGTTYSAATAADGSYVISGVPAGRYAPVAGAPGYDDAALGPSLLAWPPFLAAATRRRVPIPAGQESRLDAVLPAATAPTLSPGTDLRLGPPSLVDCRQPIPSAATRQEVTFRSGGRRNQLTLLYTPTERSTHSSPLLLTVYPGSADEWECASVPLAQAGYAVVAVGPAYSFEIERDVDEIERLLGFARAAQLPGVDGSRVALLGGSYSALHVLRILEREGSGRGVQAAVLLGPPADLFDMRRRYEDGTFIPPFGLDQALVALGLPDRAPLRYWRYSGVYHVRRDWPPALLVHSRDDPVVPYQQSEQLAAALAAAGVPHDLHVFETAGHYLLSEGAEAEAIYRLTLDFLAARLNRAG